MAVKTIANSPSGSSSKDSAGRSKSVRMFTGFKKNTSKKSIPKQLKTPQKSTVPPQKQAKTAAKVDRTAVKEHVSGPFNIRRTLHAMIDPERGLVGFPPEIEAALKSSGISIEDIKEQPDAVAKVLTFHQKEMVKKPKKTDDDRPDDRKGNKFHLPDDKKMTFEDILEKEDPTELYTNLKGIGQGAVGQIFSAIEKKNSRKSSNQRNGFETFPKRSITSRNGNHETIQTSQCGFLFWGV